MATLHVNGLSELLMSFNDLANLPKDTIKAMVKAEGEVIKKAQASHAASELHGPYYIGYTHDDIVLKPVTATQNGAKTYVTWTKTVIDKYHKDPGTRLAQIAFINQYGTVKHQGPRPFITNANEEANMEATEAAKTIFDNYIRSIGF